MTDTTEANVEVPEGAVQVGTEAETVTVPTDTQGDELLAGKFKTQEDLVKAYKELESKLGQQQPQQTEEQVPAEAGDATDTADETKSSDDGDKGGDADDPYAVYGEAVGNALKAAEVDPTTAAKEFEETGTLSDESFEKFEKAGFPKEVVEAYLRGVATATENATQITEAQVSQIKAVAGGDEGYAKLQEWMKTNVDPSEIEVFNNTVGSGDYAATVAAVAAMHNRYRQSVGHEGTLLGGKAPAQAEGYASEAEYLSDMAKPEYKTSQAFRDKVAAKLAKSPNVFMTR